MSAARHIMVSKHRRTTDDDGLFNCNDQAQTSSVYIMYITEH